MNGHTNMFHDSEEPQTLACIHQRTTTQENASIWSQLLRAVSGGAVEVWKSSYHVLSWKLSP
jgi:hypothetical protein